MSRGSIYINEVVPQGEGNLQAVTMDLSASPAELAFADTCYGFAFKKTVEHLGLELQDGPSPDLFARLRLEGSVNQAKARVPNLQQHIGLIKRYSARHRNAGLGDGAWIGRMLGGLVQHTLSELPEDTSLMRLAGIIVEPFADAVSEDGSVVYYGRYLNTGVKYEDGTPLGPFSVRDIGGLVVGANGLPLGKSVGISVPLAKSDLRQLQMRQMARENEGSAADEIIIALRQLLDSSESTIGPFAANTNEEARTAVRMAFPRVDLERASEMKLWPGTSLAEVVQHAVKTYLAGKGDVSDRPL